MPPFTANKMMKLLEDAIENVTAEDWAKVINKTKRDILADWDRDIRIDNVIDDTPFIISLTESEDQCSSDDSDVFNH